jgi:capsid protein
LIHSWRPFVTQIGVALELPFEILINQDTSSYSAAQAAIVEAWKFFSTRRPELVANFSQPVYVSVIDEAVAKGYLNAPGFMANRMLRKAYLGPRR